MNTVTMASRKAQWLAGVVASVAALMMVGGSLGLAEHYAQSGTRVQAEAGSLAHHAVTADDRNS